ncbi:MAG TPA: hypothetical protein VG651_13555 [Stellaceae bacterium]|nr:hypothetical protein [Stellaceae bacterium]
MQGAEQLRIDAAAALFDCFARAFATFDSANVAELFAVPTVGLRKDGSIIALSNREDVVRYYQAALDSYNHAACRTARWLDLETHPMGAHAFLATVSWELLRDDGSVALRWRQSYCLNYQGDRPKIFASAMHGE